MSCASPGSQEEPSTSRRVRLDLVPETFFHNDINKDDDQRESHFSPVVKTNSQASARRSCLVRTHPPSSPPVIVANRDAAGVAGASRSRRVGWRLSVPILFFLRPLSHSKSPFSSQINRHINMLSLHFSHFSPPMCAILRRAVISSRKGTRFFWKLPPPLPTFFLAHPWQGIRRRAGNRRPTT